MLDRLPKIERGGYVGLGFGAGSELELIGASDAGAVEQRVKRKLDGIGGGLFEPVCGEPRKLLRQAIDAAVDRQSPARKSIALTLRQGTKIVRSGKDNDLIQIIGIVNRVVDPKPAKAGIGRQRPFQLGASESEVSDE